MPSLDDLAQKVRDLEARLRRAEDVQAIQALKARYGTLADARYTRKGVKDATAVRRLAAELSGLFTEDAVWDGGASLGVARGRDEIRRRFEEPTLRFSWHLFVKPEIEVDEADPDRARGTWDILAPCTLKDGRPYWMAGAEDDVYRRVDGRWLHAEMRLRVAFFAPHEGGWATPGPGKGGHRLR